MDASKPSRSRSTVCGKRSSSSGSNGPGKGACQRPLETVTSGGFLSASSSSVSRNASGSGGSSSPSRSLKRTASVPPGRRTRAISSSAALVPNQWNASATNTASTLSSSSGIDSAVPTSASAPGTTRSSCARMPSSGSTAITRAKRGTSCRVSLPVPAARSRTTESAGRPSASSAASAYPGRPRSYSSAARSKLRANSLIRRRRGGTRGSRAASRGRSRVAAPPASPRRSA